MTTDGHRAGGDASPPMRPTPGAPPPSDAVLTVPNVLTFLRLALIVPVLWLGLGPDNIGGAFALAAVGFASDLVDGKIARRYGQVSRLGIVLDPLSDRLALAAGAVILIAHDLAPLWAVLLVLVRDGALVLVGAPILRAKGAPIPAVSRLGKRASFAVSMAMVLFLASGIPGVANPSEVLRILAWAFFVVGVPAYYVTAFGYVRDGLRSMRREDTSGRHG